MSILLTFSPPTPHLEGIIPTCEVFSDYILELYKGKYSKKIQRLTIVRSDGINGTHPHLHMLIETSITGNNLRLHLYKHFDINKDHYPCLLRCDKAKPMDDYYPAKTYLISNVREPNGSIVFDGHGLSDMMLKTKTEYIQKITKQQIVERVATYVANMPDPSTFTHYHFLECMRQIASQKYDLSPHMKSMEDIYNSIVMMYGDPTTVNLFKDKRY